MNEFKITKEIENDIVFSLDIGTRNVVGTLSIKDEDEYIIIDHEILEHPERAMFDGQIHDIDKVARVVRRVKEALEVRNNISLKRAAIAAAGRALKTSKVTLCRELDFTKAISKDIMDSIEMEGIQEAQRAISINVQKKEVHYYCVGYSVMRYYLDDAIIINPNGHRGYELKVDIIATFLPHVVVDSLYTVVDRVGLEVINLTLEPIAAINVAIPENLRLLNLALVDVGAGTSDIAITKDGTIVSYGMVSMAGDKITEVIASDYLLDFNSAEKLKIDLSSNDEVSFSDIVGIPHTILSSEVIGRVDESIEKITSEISREIIEYNGKAPSAVFCIGGGCQIPGFLEKLASKLDMPKERVVINIKYITNELLGPKFITPIGIGYTAFKDRDSDFLQVTVNDKPIKLFNSKTLTVLDALILVGFNPRSLIASRGESYSVSINGSERKIYGEYGEAASLYVNGKISSLDTKLKNKDAIHIENAVLGKKIYHKLSELVKEKNIVINESSINLISNIEINGRTCSLDTMVAENDNITYEEINTLEELADKLELDLSLMDIFSGEKLLDKDYKLKSGDLLTYKNKKASEKHDKGKDNISWISEESTSSLNLRNEDHNSNVMSLVEGLVEDKGVKESARNIGVEDKVSNSIEEKSEYLVIDEPGFQLYKEPLGEKYKIENKSTNQLLFNYEFLVNGERVVVKNSIKKLMFVDIFDYIDFDTSKPKGMIDLKLNGQKVNYTDELKSGDVIEISWR